MENNLLNELVVCMKYIICLFFLFHFLFTNIINLFLVAKQSKKNKTKTSTKVSKSQPEAKKTKIIDLTQDNVDFDMEERILSLKERQLEIDECELRIEHEKLELQKLKHEYTVRPLLNHTLYSHTSL